MAMTAATHAAPKTAANRPDSKTASATATSAKDATPAAKASATSAPRRTRRARGAAVTGARLIDHPRARQASAEPQAAHPRLLDVAREVDRARPDQVGAAREALGQPERPVRGAACAEPVLAAVAQLAQERALAEQRLVALPLLRWTEMVTRSTPQPMSAAVPRRSRLRPALRAALRVKLEVGLAVSVHAPGCAPGTGLSVGVWAEAGPAVSAPATRRATGRRDRMDMSSLNRPTGTPSTTSGARPIDGSD